MQTHRERETGRKRQEGMRLFRRVYISDYLKVRDDHDASTVTLFSLLCHISAKCALAASARQHVSNSFDLVLHKAMYELPLLNSRSSHRKHS